MSEDLITTSNDPFRDLNNQVNSSIKLLDTNFVDGKDQINQLIEANLNSRKTGDSLIDVGSDSNASRGISRENIGDKSYSEASKVTDFKPMFDYENSLDNPNLINSNAGVLPKNLTTQVDTIYDTQGIHATISSDSDKLPGDLSSVLLDQSLSDYLADCLQKGSIQDYKNA